LNATASSSVRSTVPSRVEYALTETGRTLLDVVHALARWPGRHVEVIRADYDQRTHATS
jgi:DNA-binding HxlR family transcriptional regulator